MNIDAKQAYDEIGRVFDRLAPGWRDPVTPPPPPPPPPDWPDVTFSRIYTSSKPEWNISFIRSPYVAEYRSVEPRNSSRIVTIGEGRSVWSCDSETLQAPTLGFTAAEKGSKGAPRFVGSGCQQGHKTARKISICTGLLNGRAVVFHSDQHSGAKSAYDDCETGRRLGELHVSGAVISAVPFEDGLPTSIGAVNQIEMALVNFLFTSR